MFKQILTASRVRARRWQPEGHPITCPAMTRRRALIVVLALTLLMTTSACQQGRLAQNPPTPGGTSSQRNHVHDPSTLSVSVTFTASTTYDQAVTAFKAAGENLYPWNCDDPRTPTAPSVSQQRITFASSHMLFIFYPTFPELDTLAAPLRCFL